MKIKTLSLAILFLLASSGLSHAAIDLTYSSAAIGAAFALIALGYMATYLFGLPQLRKLLADEVLQVLASGAMLLLLVAVAVEVDGYVVSAVSSVNDSATDIDGAMDVADGVLAGNIARGDFIYDEAHKTSIAMGREGSKSIFCVFLGVGFSLNNCGQLNAFRGSLTTTGFVSSTALSALHAEQALLSLFRSLSFAFLIPVGLFLRCFKAGRQAGGALIAIGFGFYTAFPVAIVATEKMLQDDITLPAPPFPNVTACDPKETDNARARAFVLNYSEELTEFGRVESITYNLLVRAVFASIFSIMVTLVFIRSLAKMLGSEIDVSALSRIS